MNIHTGRYIPKNTYLCHGMKKPLVAKNGSRYTQARMQIVNEDGHGDIVKLFLFGTERLPAGSHKNKYFVFSRVDKNASGGGTVRLSDLYEIYDDYDNLPCADVTSDDEYE